MSKFESLKNSVKRCAQAVKDFLGFSEPEKGPLSDFHTYAPDMMNLYAKGIEDNIDTVEDSVNDVAKAVSGTFSADIGYNLPDIAGYAADLSAMITATSSTEIIVPLNVDGREIARASAWYMNEQLAWEAR
jgi:phage-related protein